MQIERSALPNDKPGTTLKKVVVGNKCLDCPSCNGICAAIIDAMTVPDIVAHRSGS